VSDSWTSDDRPDHREEKDVPDSGATMAGRNDRDDRVKEDARLESAVSLDSQIPVDDTVVDDTVEAVIYTELMRASGEAHAVDPQSGSAEDDSDRAGGSVETPRAPRAVEARDVRGVHRSVERPSVPPADHHHDENPGFFTSLARFLGLSKDD